MPGVSGAPVNPYTPGEYEEVEGEFLASHSSSAVGICISCAVDYSKGIMLAFDKHNLEVVAAIAAGVTLDGGSKVFMVSSAAQKFRWEAEFKRAGVDRDKVVWVQEDIDR